MLNSIHDPATSPSKDSRSLCLRSGAGFSLVELIVVVAIIGLLIAIIIPTIAKARETSLRVMCASNLRQCGFVESIYSNENHGWLLMREFAHAGTISNLCPPGSGYYSIDLAKYSSPLIWFCPEYTNTGTTTDQILSDSARVSAIQNVNLCGYGFFGAAWDGTQVVSSDPSNGSICSYTNPNASKQAHLRPYMVRMTEWYADNWTHWGNNGGSKWHTGHKGTPEGGNLLYGDGSVSWSRNIFTFYAGEHYTVPEGYPSVP